MSLSERAWPIAASLVALLGLGATARGEERSIPALPITAHVAALEGSAVTSDRWLDEQVGRANEVFRPYGVSFCLVERRALSESHARLETRVDRHALGALVREKRINWFVVESLRDVDDPSRYRRGVHWRPLGSPGVHFVVVSKIASPTVLAHELGHFFGSHRHSRVPGNLMSYERGEGLPFFNATQSRRLKAQARRFLETGELVAATQLGPCDPR